MDELKNLRDEIDRIDETLVNLFERRMEIVLKVGKYKKENNIPILSSNRESEVIKKNLEYLNNKRFEKPTKQFLTSIMDISKKVQTTENANTDNYVNNSKHINKSNLLVGFQGVEGAFSEQALYEYFGEDVKTKKLINFKDVFDALKNNDIDYGILPIENSSTGAIVDVYDLLRQYGFYIIGEKCIKIDQHLLGIQGSKIEDIEEVYSHPQGFHQSSEFFRNHPEWRLIPYSNTATSAKMIRDHNVKTKAAVASIRAAEIYDLNILKHNINFNKSNDTRFLIIGKNLEIVDANKISVVVNTPHRAGALYGILRYFAENNLNMLKIESRPMVNKSWEYFFYIDFEGNLNKRIVKEALKLINENCSSFQLLGNYKSHIN